MSKIPQEAIEALDWANFDEIKLNREWLPNDQDLIYTAINAYNGEGDMDDDCLEQIIERLLLAWRRADAARVHGAEVAVKPLEWSRSGWVEAFAHPDGIGVWYSISPKNPTHGPGNPPFSLAVYVSEPGKTKSCSLGSEFPSLEEAKAAAQADYEQRIRSALTAPPAPQPTERERVLGEALRPFAKLAKVYDPDEGDDEDKCWVHEYTPTLGDLRRARAALAGGEA